MTTVDRIIQLIDEKRISALQLTTDCGLSNNAVTAWTAGRANPSTKALVKIADYFGVSMDWLCGRTNVMPLAQTTTSGRFHILTPQDEQLFAIIQQLKPKEFMQVKAYAINLLKTSK